MRTLQHQKGFANIVMLIVGLSMLMYLMMYGQQRFKIVQIQNVIKPFYQHLDHIKNQVNAYQIDQIAQGWPPSSAAVFPNAWSNLQPAYLPNCSTTDNNAGKCRKPEQTPWGTSMAMTRISSPIPSSLLPRYRLQIQIPLPNATSDATRLEHQAVLELFGRFPGSEYIEASNSLIVWIDRIDTGVQQDALVKRSGDDSTLTGDWDVGGNYAITNAKDFTIRNTDGSQRRLGAGTVSTVTAKHNQRITKHTCPVGLTPAITTSIKGIFNETDPNFSFANVGSSRSYTVNSSTYWTVKLDYLATVNGVVSERHDGEVIVQLICQ